MDGGKRLSKGEKFFINMRKICRARKVTDGGVEMEKKERKKILEIIKDEGKSKHKSRWKKVYTSVDTSFAWFCYCQRLLSKRRVSRFFL